MLITGSAILLGLFFVLRPLQRNMFYMIHMGIVLLFLHYVETYVFTATPFATRTILFVLLCHLVSINFITFWAYGHDKKAAKKGKFRVSEKNMHFLELLGGVIGAIMGQRVFNHKTRKKEYIAMFRFICVLELVIIFIIFNYLEINLKSFI